MKEYFISRTGGEFSFSYTIDSSKTLTWQDTQTHANWFTWSATGGVLKVSCGEVEGLVKKSITLIPLIDGEACGGIIVSQRGSDVICDCDALSLDKSSSYYNVNPIPYTGGSFTYDYEFETCNGSHDVSFRKVSAASWYSIDNNIPNQRLTVTVNDAGSRTGSDLEGSIIYSVNSEDCATIDFKQDATPLPACGCATLNFDKDVDYYVTNLIDPTGETFTYTYSFDECLGDKNVSFAKVDSSQTFYTFSHNSSTKTLTVTVDAVGERTDLSGGIVCSVNNVTCTTISFEQALPECGCATLNLDKAENYYTVHPIDTTGGSFTYNYSFSNCEGSKSVVIRGLESGWYTISSGSTWFTVNVDAAGTRTGSDLNGTITISYSYSGIVCKTVTFSQALPACGCATLNFDKAIDYYTTNPLATTGGSFNYTYSFANCSGDKNVTFTKATSATWYSITTGATGFTVTYDAVGTRSGSDLNGGVVYAVNGVTCSTITFSQSLPACGCNVLSFDKALNYYTVHPIDYSGGSFTYTYTVAPCEGNQTVTFKKSVAADYYQFSVNTTNHTLTVTVNDVGSRTGSSLNGAINCFMNEDASTICGTITFTQNLAPCDCDDLIITLRN